MGVRGLSTLFVSASMAAIATAATASQPAGSSDGSVVEEVVVTGTNTRRPAADNLVPVQVLGRDEVLRTGAAQVSDVLRTIPANTGSALYNETGLLSGTAQFQLRGLGFSSTLTLVNGRRAGVAPLSDKSGADFLDINQFPTSMIQRIDVLKDGASAIYGSEAVAGVVNIITRRGFDGFEITAQAQTSSNESYGVNLAAGQRSERGYVSLYGAYHHQTQNVRTDFDWIMERIGGDGVPGRSQLLSSNGYPGTFSRARLNASGAPAAVAGAPTTPDPHCEALGGVFRIADNGTVNRSTCNFDFVDQIGIIPEVHRLQAFVEARYDLSDRLTWFNETSASRNLNFITKQPGSYSNGLVAGSGFLFVPASHPFNFFVQSPTNPNAIVYKDPATWNPAVDQAVDLVANYRPEGGVYRANKRQENINIRVLNGFEVELSRDWVTSLSHMYAYARFSEEDPVRYNADALNRLTLAGQYNPFGTAAVSPDLVSPKDGTSLAANTAAILGQVFYTSNVVRRTEQHVVDFGATGPLWAPPTGEITMAVGAQYRALTLTAIPDSLAAAGQADSPATESSVRGRQVAKSVYGELSVPLTGRADVQLALRHDAYEGAIGSSTDPKIAAGVNVFDWLRLRGSWGTSFQAPTLNQTSTSQAFQIINDPVVLTPDGLACGAAATGNNVLVVTEGGSLEPQKSKSLTLGADLRPVSRLRVTADYWRYDYSNLIAAGQNGQAIVNGQCSGGAYQDDPRVQRGAAGQLFRINTAYVNVGKVITDGVDLSATYDWPDTGFGDLSFRLDATYVRKFDVYGPGGAVSDRVGSRNFNTNFAPMPEWRASGAVRWSFGLQSVSLGVQYTDGYLNDQSNNAPIDSFTTVDLQVSRELPAVAGSEAPTLTLGVNNLFNEDPPALNRYNAAGAAITGTVSDIDRPGYDPLAGADIRGRSFYVTVKQTF